MRFDVHPFASVEVARGWARAEIDAAAGVARARFITVIPGQVESYNAKYREAQAYLAGGGASSAQAFPWLTAEAAASGSTLSATAGRIKERGDAWNLVVGPCIEALRTGGKLQLSELATIAAVIQATRIVLDHLQAVGSDPSIGSTAA